MTFQTKMRRAGEIAEEQRIVGGDRQEIEERVAELEREIPQMEAELSRGIGEVERRLGLKAATRRKETEYACDADGGCSLVTDPEQRAALVRAGLARPGAAGEADWPTFLRACARAAGGPNADRALLEKLLAAAPDAWGQRARGILASLTGGTVLATATSGVAGKAFQLEGPERDEWDERFDRQLRAVAAVTGDLRALSDEIRGKARDAALDAAHDARHGDEQAVEAAARAAVARVKAEHETEQERHRRNIAGAQAAAALEAAVREGRSTPGHIDPRNNALRPASIVEEREREAQERLARLARERDEQRRIEDAWIAELERQHREQATHAMLGVRVRHDGTIVE